MGKNRVLSGTISSWLRIVAGSFVRSFKNITLFVLSNLICVRLVGHKYAFGVLVNKIAVCIK